MAYNKGNQEYLGIDSNVLIAYLIPEHPDHASTKGLTRERHAVNPTVIHETFHTSVFKLKRKPRQTLRTLLDYMDLALCLPADARTVELGLNLAVKHSLGGRDALILSTYLLSKEVKSLVTMDKALLSLREVRFGKRILKISPPR